MTVEVTAFLPPHLQVLVVPGGFLFILIFDLNFFSQLTFFWFGSTLCDWDAY